MSLVCGRLKGPGNGRGSGSAVGAWSSLSSAVGGSNAGGAEVPVPVGGAIPGDGTGTIDH